MNNHEIFDRINGYIKSLYELPEYRNLQVSETMNLYPSIKKQVKITSNADIVIPNSISAKNLIKEFAERVLDEEKTNQTLNITLNFTTLKKTDSVSKKEKEEKDREDIFILSEPKHKFSDIVLPSETLADLNSALSAIKYAKLINEEWGWKEASKSTKSVICFYGVPGTGKTMTAHAVADLLGKKILIASYADIQSMYVGEGPKNLNSVFEKAQKTQSLLFFDEADAFLRKRSSDNQNSASMHYNSMTNEMMKHLEDFDGIVIFATNLTENTDEAFKTRITASIKFVSPDAGQRKDIIKKLIPAAVPKVREFTDDDYDAISNACDGFVGRDIRNAIHYVLCNGAENATYPFSVESFIDGCKHYKETKLGFSPDKPTQNNDVSSQISLMGTNGDVMALLTYVAWLDGAENEEETTILKRMSKILGRTKPIINKISDLPELSEMCDNIKNTKAVPYTIKYIFDVLSVSDSFKSVEKKIIEILNNILGGEISREIVDKLYMHSLESYKDEKDLEEMVLDKNAERSHV